MSKRQSARDRALVRKLKGMVHTGFPAHDSAWTSGARYCPSLARYRGDPQAIVSSPAQAREVAKRNGQVIHDLAR